MATAAAMVPDAMVPEAMVPDAMKDFVVGLIGMGDMGKMYADRLAAAGWR